MSVLIRTTGPVTTITLSRPERRNALDAPTIDLLLQALRAVQDDPTCQAVVLTGADGAFCAGGDTSEDLSRPHPIRRMEAISRASLTLGELPVPVVARVDGAAIGAGCSLALACDLVVASERSVFAVPFVQNGLSPDFGASWALPRRVGEARARELLLLGRRLCAQEALAWGLVNSVCPEGDLDDTVREWTTILTAAPAHALSATRRLLRSAPATLGAALEAESLAQALNITMHPRAAVGPARSPRKDPHGS